ncbi:DUF4288 domain-containing protein [Arenimonas sp.]|uniref:DUF4288 domain-containing protein n=1 Tax=Arenimonas sp. TaxID=1872635 RepID=UPI0039E3033E
MTWYAAHILIGVRRADGRSSETLVHENIVLLEAVSSQMALEKAQEIGREEAVIDDQMTIDDAPAIRQFIGVRKMVNVSNPHPLDADQDRPVSGTEISYLEFRVSNERLADLAAGESVELEYLE